MEHKIVTVAKEKKEGKKNNKQQPINVLFWKAQNNVINRYVIETAIIQERNIVECNMAEWW